MTDRVAALYDIHGNLPALEAALRAAANSGASTLVIGGDLALGPMPRETLDLLIALGPSARFLRGNCDRLMVAAFDGQSLDQLPPSIRETVMWAATQIDRSHRDFLARLPLTITLDVAGCGDVLFCHATPRNDDEIFTPRSAEGHVAPMFDGVPDGMVVCGHTHIQFDHRFGERRVINAGSIGMPCGEPAAHWLLFDRDVRLIQTDYDRAAAAERIEASPFPTAKSFVAHHVLNVPSVEAMLTLLDAAGSR